MLEAFFLGAKFRGVGDYAATGAARGMLDVQHFVEENILHHKLWNAGTVHAAVQDDLVRAGIVATELAAPSPCAPSHVWAVEFARKVLLIETLEERRKIMVPSLRRDMGKADAVPTHAADAFTGAVRTGVRKIRLNQSAINTAARDTRKK